MENTLFTSARRRGQDEAASWKRVMLLLLALWLSSAPEKTEPPCVAKTKALVTRVEAMPLHRRHAAIDLAVRKDPSLLCGVVDRKFFSEALPVPVGCTAARCPWPGGMEIAPEVLRDVGLDLYVRVQTIAARMNDARRFSPSHERLLSTWLLSAGIAASEKHDH